eukprot:11604268-Heterocapsa_arctica.AAC.1
MLPMMNPATWRVSRITATTAQPILLSLGSDENFPPEASVANNKLLGSMTGQVWLKIPKVLIPCGCSKVLIFSRIGWNQAPEQETWPFLVLCQGSVLELLRRVDGNVALAAPSPVKWCLDCLLAPGAGLGVDAVGLELPLSWPYPPLRNGLEFA